MNENENEDIEEQDNEPRQHNIEKQSTSSLGLDNIEESAMMGNIVLDGKVQDEDLDFIEKDSGKVCNEEEV